MTSLFTGRIARLNYFLTEVMLFIIALAYNFFIARLSHTGVFPTFIAYYFVVSFFIFSLMIRRLHDINWSGWLSLITLIPLAGFVLALILLFKSGTKGNNKYGSEPKIDIDIFDTLWPSESNDVVRETTQTIPTTPPQV